MSAAPDLRRDTPLAQKLKARIAAAGPIPVRDFMRACLDDPEHGYYRTQQAIGRDGDFITAPEISQVFGELIGLWAAVVWQQMGAPPSFDLVELGPGRGTLMADLMRAARIVPGFVAAAQIRLVEPNPVLVAEQKRRLEGTGLLPCWHRNLDEVATGPTILLANEVLDVLPVAQFQLTAAGWSEVTVGLGTDGRLVFAPGTQVRQPPSGSLPAGAAAGDVVETRDCGEVSSGLARLAAGGPLAALFIDYGHLGPAVGDTLQAVRRQQYEHPLASPGEADLSAQVDFKAFADQGRAAGFACDGPVFQAAFLGSLGAVERASRLMAAQPAKAAAIELGVARLLAPGGMGTRFLALGLRSPALPPLPGFPVVDSKPPPP